MIIFPLDESVLTKIEGSNVLGKLQITWRMNLGEPGRLQTQQILAYHTQRDRIESIAGAIVIILEKPFTNLIAMELGMQKISGITLFNIIKKKTYDPLRDIEDKDMSSGSNTCVTPFREGLRLFPGLDLARLEAFIFLHHFLTEFR